MNSSTNIAMAITTTTTTTTTIITLFDHQQEFPRKEKIKK